jgi:sRNA-binding carbon storage regulator CsrA
MKSIRNSLLLSRKEGESQILEIGNEKIIVNLDESCKGRSKIRICASRNVKIYREEVYLKNNCLFNVENPTT